MSIQEPIITILRKLKDSPESFSLSVRGARGESQFLLRDEETDFEFGMQLDRSKKEVMRIYKDVYVDKSGDIMNISKDTSSWLSTEEYQAVGEAVLQLAYDRDGYAAKVAAERKVKDDHARALHCKAYGVLPTQQVMI